MTATELKDLIIVHGLHPIPIVLPVEGDDQVPRFDGTLGDFLAAAKALSSKVIFLAIHQMSESDFLRPSPGKDESYIDDEEGDRAEVIELEEVQPSIARYRKHIGNDCAFHLTAKGGYAEIDYLLTEPWWDVFQAEAAEAVETWSRQMDSEREAEDSENEKRSEELLRQLRSLVYDWKFGRLRTQRAMLAYALDKIPDLEYIEESTLKQEIQTLRARIEARGLNK